MVDDASVTEDKLRTVLGEFRHEATPTATSRQAPILPKPLQHPQKWEELLPEEEDDESGGGGGGVGKRVVPQKTRKF